MISNPSKSTLCFSHTCLCYNYNVFIGIFITIILHFFPICTWIFDTLTTAFRPDTDWHN